MKENGDFVHFFRNKDYIMVNNDLGAGSFGKTVVLQDPFIDELFVAKKYEPYYEDDRKAFYDSFLQEIKIMHKLNHRNVVRIYNYYAYDEQYTGYILMEYIIGETLPDYMKSICSLGDFEKIDDLFVQLIDGFRYIESQGIVHRDIREGNIMVDTNGVVKIIDFGLGKTFKPIDTSVDSKNAIINRCGLDALPDEFIEGNYTSQTDMFYIAELFNRILRKNESAEHFSYMPILKKMMMPKRQERFSSFAAIQEAINAKDFSTMEISSEDKRIYQDFSNAVHQSIAKFSEGSEFNYSVEEFEKRLQNLLKVNCFEDYIQSNEQLIKTIVSAPFQYYSSATTHIKCDIVIRFQRWFLSLTPDSKKLVLYNIISKLSNIPVEAPEPELPF